MFWSERPVQRLRLLLIYRNKILQLVPASFFPECCALTIKIERCTQRLKMAPVHAGQPLTALLLERLKGICKLLMYCSTT